MSVHRLFSLLILGMTLLTICVLPATAKGMTQPVAFLFDMNGPTERAPGSVLAAGGVTYFIRPDGGSVGQCTGRVDAAYPGAGLAQPCAWNHPFQALPPGGQPRIAGGDTLIIGSGSYQMGYGAPGTDACDPDGAWDCHMPPIPAGPDSNTPTRILGAGWDRGCVNPPQLWGTQRTDWILDLTHANHVTVACLEITDHSGCVEFHSGGLACTRDAYPFGDWASTGLVAADAADVTLRDLDIHGFANTGVRAGRLTDWTVERVKIVGNGWAGWDGDIAGTDSNSGTLTYRQWTVAWNGCGESWPGRQPVSCWAQEAGGYGDGVGTGETQGRWIIEDSAFLYNTSDGLDLLYTRPGAQIEIRRTWAEGNAGNQIKSNGPITMENSIVVGNCGFFDGKPFTFNVDPCRALGTALQLNVWRGDQVRVINNTVAGEGDCLVVAECSEPGGCAGTERVTVANNIFQGTTDFMQPFELACLMYQETFPADPFVADYNVIVNVKDDLCPGPNDLCVGDPGLVNNGIDSFDAHLRPGSPAINSANPAIAPAQDYDGLPRDAQPDRGAVEYRVWAYRSYLPAVSRSWSVGMFAK